MEGGQVLVQELPGGRVLFGPGTLAMVPAESERLGCAAVLLIAGTSAKPHADEVAAALGGRLAGRIDGVVPHVPEQVAAEALRLATEAGADGLVSVGGGSATGLAKAVARSTGVPILAVPTTYAGSEMTAVWGITAGGRKTTGSDPAVRPRTVVYDPRLTVSMPPGVTAASGMNAAAHCVAALTAGGSGVGPLTTLFAEEGLRALAGALPACVERPADLGARGEALRGAWLAGLALAGGGTGPHHRICHVLGGSFGLPHADVHAVVLPHAAGLLEDQGARALRPSTRLARVAAALGADDAPGGLWDLARRTGASQSLRQLGLREEDLDAAAAQVAAADRRVDQPAAAALLRRASKGRRPAPT
jgi:maleylacetate reductase